MIKLPLDNKNLVKIHQHDVEMHEYTALDNNGIMTPFAWALLIHIGVIGLVVVGNLLPNREQQPLVETALITSEQLATIKSQVLANRSEAAKSNTNDPNQPSQANKTSSSSTNPVKANTHSTNIRNQKTQTVSSQPRQTQTQKSQPTKEVRQKVEVTLPDKMAEDNPVFQKSPETIAYEKKLAATQKQHDAAMRAFETEAERTAQAKFKAKAEAEEKLRKEQQDKVAEYKDIELETAQKEEERRQALENLALERENNIRRKEIEGNKSITNSLIASGAAELASKQLLNSGVSGTASQSIGARVTQSNHIGMTISRIKNRLRPPVGSGHDSTKLEVTVDATGRVIRASASGTNQALNRAAEKAARDASPLPIKMGDKDYPTFIIDLHGKGNR